VVRVGYAFPIGVLIHQLHRSGFRAPQIPGLALLAGLGVVMLDVRTSGSLHTWFEIGFALVLCPAVVWIGASVSVGRLSVALAQFFGRISYAVYVLHLPLLWLLIALSKPASEAWGISPLVLSVTFTAVVVFIAWWADAYFDKPINRALTRAFALGKAPVATIDDPRLAS
jgi:peptidoglycan/LPS O-acetylase OafA/YrhL